MPPTYPRIAIGDIKLGDVYTHYEYSVQPIDQWRRISRARAVAESYVYAEYDSDRIFCENVQTGRITYTLLTDTAFLVERAAARRPDLVGVLAPID